MNKPLDIDEIIKLAHIELEKVLDEHFPKIEEEGEEKRLNKRGAALIVFAYAMIILREALARHGKQIREADIEAVSSYQNPYPEDVFIPPSKEWLQELNEFCISKGHTLDAISAEMGRRAVKNTKEDIITSLKNLNEEEND